MAMWLVQLHIPQRLLTAVSLLSATRKNTNETSMYYGQPSLVRLFFKIKLADLQYCAALLSWLTYILLSFVVHMLCLQCFDAVGWAAGRASGL